MSSVDPDRMRDALDLLVHTAEEEIGRVRARITSLVASVSADAQAVVERHKADGADAVESGFLQMHVRELAAAQAELSERKDRLRDLNSVIEFAGRAGGKR